MPLAKVHVVKGKTGEHKRAVMQAVQEALVSAFEIPAKDVTQLLLEFDKEHVDGKNSDFTYIEVIAIAGRSKEAKRKLYRFMVDNVCRLTKLQPCDVLIMIYDMPKDNCGIRGGHMASEVELGFKVDV